MLVTIILLIITLIFLFLEEYIRGGMLTVTAAIVWIISLCFVWWAGYRAAGFIAYIVISAILAQAVSYAGKVCFRE